MQRFSKSQLAIGLTIPLLLISLLGSLPAVAATVPVHGHPGHGAGGGHAAAIKQASHHGVMMRNVPRATPQQLAKVQVMPQPGFNSARYRRFKEQARTNPKAPRGMHPQPSPRLSSSRVRQLTPGTNTSFQGIASSSTGCGGDICEPPDMALAASPSWVFEGVNSSFAIYDTNGALQVGPVLAQDFLGVPDPGACATTTTRAFMSDPRAFYDPVDQRFWVAMAEIEGAGGINTNCPEKTLYWIAVSQTSDPTGGWYIYDFDMSLGTTNLADFTQFGFNQTAIFFSADMFNQVGSNFQYEEIFGALKSPLEAGSFPGFYGWWGFQVWSSRTINASTVQPVEAFDSTGGGLFISSYNGGEFGQFQGDPFGDDCITTACHGLAIWSLSDPGTPSTHLSVALVDTNSYILPPKAAQQGSSSRVNTGDTRISGTPTYHNGQISFSLNTSVATSGGANVSGILWGQVSPSLDDSGNITGASLYQNGYFFYGGDSSAYYGALMPNAAGGLLMVYEFSSDTFSLGFPGVAYVTQDPGTPLGSFSDGGIFLRSGDAPTTDDRWGDYEAASYNGNSSEGGTDTVWFSGEYAPTDGLFGGDWSTYIGSANF